MSIPLSLASWINSDAVFSCLRGAAGTGKTETIIALVETLGRRACPLAPTNKAVGVLKARGVAAMTVHSALFRATPTGKSKTVKKVLTDPTTHQPLRDDAGGLLYAEVDEPEYTYGFDAETLLIKFPRLRSLADAVLIIDESSMVPAKIWRHIAESGLRVIAVGDPNQLPPVEEREIDPLDRPYLDYFHKAPATETLTTNHRQADGNAIRSVIDTIRTRGSYPLPFNAPDAQCYDPTWDKKNFTSPDIIALLGVADIVVAHKRITVDKLNNIVREAKHAAAFVGLTPLQRLLPRIGDRLYVNARYGHHCEIDGQARFVTIFAKGDMLTIVGDVDYDLKEGVAVVAVQKDDDTRVRTVLIALNFVGVNKKDRKIAALWVDYAFAITCHKAQGSQWPIVIVVDDNVYYNRTAWLYTACSRASQNLVVLRGTP